MSAATLLTFFYPMSKKMDAEQVVLALSLAEGYRPQCLPEEKQIEAVAWYAAYLLAQSLESEVNLAGLRREREGDLEREYFANSDNGSHSAQFLAKFNQLNDLCKRLGSITVGNANGGCGS